MSVASVGFASPLTDFAKGKTSIDITWRPSATVAGKYSGGFSGTDRGEVDSNWDWRITTGMGNRWAVQYNQYNAIAQPKDQGVGVRTKEFNILYQLNQNLAAFMGCHWAEYSSAHVVVTPTKNTMQLGLIGNTKIADKTNLYGVIGFGKNVTNFESGISYEFAKNTELNVSYRYKRVQELHDTFIDGDYTDDIAAKGWGYGITYKF